MSSPTLPASLVQLVQRHSRINQRTLTINCHTLADAKQLVQHSVAVASWVLINHRSISQIAVCLHNRPLYPSFSPYIALPQVWLLQPEIARVIEQVDRSDLPVCLADHHTHQCLLLSAHYGPDRIVWNRLDYQKHVNFKDAWAPDRLADLLQLLKQQLQVQAFEYTIRRVDGRTMRCIKDFKLVQLCGRPVRVSRSHYWELLPDDDVPFDSR